MAEKVKCALYCIGYLYDVKTGCGGSGFWENYDVGSPAGKMNRLFYVFYFDAYAHHHFPFKLTWRIDILAEKPVKYQNHFQIQTDGGFQSK